MVFDNREDALDWNEHGRMGSSEELLSFSRSFVLLDLCRAMESDVM
jgi:hypothetical protein